MGNDLWEMIFLRAVYFLSSDIDKKVDVEIAMNDTGCIAIWLDVLPFEPTLETFRKELRELSLPSPLSWQTLR